MRTIGVMIAGLSVLLGTMAMAETVVDEEAGRAALGMDGSGRFLVVDVPKACSFIEPIHRQANPQDRILIFSDSDVELLGSGICEGACDMLTLNNLMVACQQDTGGICAPIAGIHDGILYDLSFDATGKSLADCGL